MSMVTRLARETYIPQFVLGGLAGVAGPVILRHVVATAVPTAVTTFLEQLLGPPRHPFATQAVSPEKPEISVPICFLVLPIQAMCAIEPILSTQTLRSVPASSALPSVTEVPLPVDLIVLPIQVVESVQIVDSMQAEPIQPLPTLASVLAASVPPSTIITPTLVPVPTSSNPPAATIPEIIGSYLLSPLVILQLACLCSIFIFVTKRRRLVWRSERIPLHNKTDDLDVAPPRSESSPPRTRILQRKPSDAPNWRIPRNGTMKPELVHPPIQPETISSAPRPPRQRSVTSPTIHYPPVARIPPNITATNPTVVSELPKSPPAASPMVPLTAPTYIPPVVLAAGLAYIPPHRRASFDLGGRRPLADVARPQASSFLPAATANPCPAVGERLSPAQSSSKSPEGHASAPEVKYQRRSGE
ncbi:hypothetical protein K438DRAFT_1953349 [Mycena galopus ATCC 62051]|nr:hypothetical protein K438DRAFT_1953349 [Mycena galopus ATCC 62051]